MNNMYVYILDPKRNKMIFANTQIQPKDWAYKPQVKNKFFACIITKAWISKEGICGHLGCKEGGGGGGLCIYRMFHHVSSSINIIICLKIFGTKFIKTITLTSAICCIFSCQNINNDRSSIYLYLITSARHPVLLVSNRGVRDGAREHETNKQTKNILNSIILFLLSCGCISLFCKNSYFFHYIAVEKGLLYWNLFLYWVFTLLSQRHIR